MDLGTVQTGTGKVDPARKLHVRIKSYLFLIISSLNIEDVLRRINVLSFYLQTNNFTPLILVLKIKTRGARPRWTKPVGVGQIGLGLGRVL